MIFNPKAQTNYKFLKKITKTRTWWKFQPSILFNVITIFAFHLLMVPLWSLLLNKMLLKTLALQTKSLDYNKSTLWDTMGMKRKTSADMLPCSLYCVGVWLDNWEAEQRNDLFVSTQCQFLSLLPVHYGKWLVSVSPDVTSCRPRCVAPRDQGLARVRVRRQNKFHSVAHCPESSLGTALINVSVGSVD